MSSFNAAVQLLPSFIRWQLGPQVADSSGGRIGKKSTPKRILVVGMDGLASSN